MIISERKNRVDSKEFFGYQDFGEEGNNRQPMEHLFRAVKLLCRLV